MRHVIIRVADVTRDGVLEIGRHKQMYSINLAREFNGKATRSCRVCKARHAPSVGQYWLGLSPSVSQELAAVIHELAVVRLI